MSQKKKKCQRVNDAIVAPAHIQIARDTLFKSGLRLTMEKINSVEPELAEYITAAAKEIAAGMMDCEMPRAVAMELRHRITTLAASVYGAYNLAVYQHYKDLFQGTAIRALDDEPEPPLPPYAPPQQQGEQGGECGVG